MHLGLQGTPLSPEPNILAHSRMKYRCVKIYILVKYILRKSFFKRIFFYRVTWKFILHFPFFVFLLNSTNLPASLSARCSKNATLCAIYKLNNSCSLRWQNFIYKITFSSSSSCDVLKLSHTISANHSGSILCGNLSVWNIIVRRTKSCLDGYSRGLVLLKFTHIIAFLRRVSNFRRHARCCSSLLYVCSLYIKELAHEHSLLHSFNRDMLLTKCVHELALWFWYLNFFTFCSIFNWKLHATNILNKIYLILR